MNEPLANCVMYDLLQNFAVGGCFFIPSQQKNQLLLRLFDCHDARDRNKIGRR